MRIDRLAISNFKGVEHFEISDLEEMVVIAGPNGCGKSSVLDAIRLLKSAYGGYQPNELQQWFGEFQFNLNRNPGELARLLRDKDRPLVVELDLSLADVEREYLLDDTVSLVWPLVWRQLVPQGIARDAGRESTENSLQTTLRELFELFFEGKSFEGVQPTESGRPAFPVLLQDGSSHDIDDLSSGEKEILYGYLRLRNARSSNSVVLLDEPELHLNPRLVRGLPVFYQQHIGRVFNNQIWLIRHSDALLRESVGNPGFSVFHMHARGGVNSGNQAQQLDTASELDRAIVEIVGDLAAYRPGAPILIVEGGGDSTFDAHMISRLFPEIADRVNLVSGGAKGRVRELLRLLRSAADAGAVLGGSVHAVVDRDSDVQAGADEPGLVQWSAYHIENYLLDEAALAASLVAILGQSPFQGESEITERLIEAARRTMPELVIHRLRVDANRELIRSIDLSFDPDASDVAVELAAAIDRSRERFVAAAEDLTPASLMARVEEIRSQLNESLESGTWRQDFQGRSVLKRFAASLPESVSYDILRNVTLDQMVKMRTQPPEMLEV